MQASALEAFGRTMAERPINLDKVAQCRQELRSIGGDELVLEASATVGAFVLTTEVVDTTGRNADPKLMNFIRRIMFIKTHKSMIKLSLATMVVAIAAVKFARSK